MEQVVLVVKQDVPPTKMLDVEELRPLPAIVLDRERLAAEEFPPTSLFLLCLTS